MDQQNQQPAKSSFNITDLIVKALPVLTIVFIALAVLGFFYGFLMGIINAAQYSSFGLFLDGVALGFQRLGFNVFAAAVLAGISKLIGKKQN